MAGDIADTVDGQNKELKKTVEIHIQATRQAAEQIQVQLADALKLNFGEREKILIGHALTPWMFPRTMTKPPEQLPVPAVADG